MCKEMFDLVDETLENVDLHTREFQKVNRSIMGFQKHMQKSVTTTKKLGK